MSVLNIKGILKELHWKPFKIKHNTFQGLEKAKCSTGWELAHHQLDPWTIIMVPMHPQK